MERTRSSTRFVIVVVTLLLGSATALMVFATRSTNGDEFRTIVLRPVPGSQVTDLPTRLRDAAAVLRLRLAALDRRAIVEIKDGTLVVQAPPVVADQLSRLGSPGQLEMRPVLAIEPARACVQGVTAPDLETTACSQDQRTSYLLGPARLTGASVKGADVTDSDSSRHIQVQLTTLGRTQFSKLTRELSTQRVPRNQVAILIDGVVLSAPEVRGVITGDTQISGGFTHEQARALAATIRYGGLPLAFVLSEGAPP